MRRSSDSHSLGGGPSHCRHERCDVVEPLHAVRRRYQLHRPWMLNFPARLAARMQPGYRCLRPTAGRDSCRLRPRPGGCATSEFQAESAAWYADARDFRALPLGFFHADLPYLPACRELCSCRVWPRGLGCRSMLLPASARVDLGVRAPEVAGDTALYRSGLAGQYCAMLQIPSGRWPRAGGGRAAGANPWEATATAMCQVYGRCLLETGGCAPYPLPAGRDERGHATQPPRKRRWTPHGNGCGSRMPLTAIAFWLVYVSGLSAAVVCPAVGVALYILVPPPPEPHGAEVAASGIRSHLRLRPSLTRHAASPPVLLATASAHTY